MRVLGTPASTTTASTRLSSARISEVIRWRCERFSGPVRGGMFNRLVGPAWVAAGVSPMESTAMKPTRTPSRSMITGRRAAAKFRPAPTVWIWPESKRARVCRSASAVVSDVVVGQGQQIEPGRRSAGLTRGLAAKSRPLSRRPVGGQRRLEVAERDLGGRQPLGERLQRRSGVSTVTVADAAAEHDVADGSERGDLSTGRTDRRSG